MLSPCKWLAQQTFKGRKGSDQLQPEKPCGSIVLPFWSNEHWHVAVRRPWGEVVVVDLWGDHNPDDSRVRNILQHVIWISILTLDP